MRKGSKIIYSGNGWDMTVRELMFSIVIILIMLMGGFFISEKIAPHNDEQNQEYYQAMQIDGNAELFQYGMRTDVGNAFVKGNLVAVDPVTDPGIGGVPTAAGFLGTEKYVADAFGVELNARTNVSTAEGAYATGVKNVFAAGDVHRGQSLVVWAIREGREVAHAVDESLMGYSYLSVQ